MPAPLLTAKPNPFLLLEPSSLPLQETQSPLLLRVVLFGLRADFSISSSYRLISTLAPHSPYAADSLSESSYTPVGAYVLQEVLLSSPRFPTLLYIKKTTYFLLSLSFLKLLIFFFFPSLPTQVLGILILSRIKFLYSISTNLTVKDCYGKYLHLFIYTKIFAYVHFILIVHCISNFSKNYFGELHHVLHL